MKHYPYFFIFCIMAILAALIVSGCGRSSFHKSSICTVEEIENGAMISCEDGTMAVVYNGEDGEDGMDGTSPILRMLDPCGNEPGYVDELLLVTDSGVIAWYKNVGLTLIEPGVRYRTTDKQRCEFEINANGELVYEEE